MWQETVQIISSEHFPFETDYEITYKGKMPEREIISTPYTEKYELLYGEFKELFPHNSVEYFVSYYDYYQPEAYVPASDTFIEKDSLINEEIDRMRHSAMHGVDGFGGGGRFNRSARLACATAVWLAITVGDFHDQRSEDLSPRHATLVAQQGQKESERQRCGREALAQAAIQLSQGLGMRKHRRLLEERVGVKHATRLPSHVRALMGQKSGEEQAAGQGIVRH